MFTGMMNGFYRLCEWVIKLAYINILWILFTCMGLIIFGIYPATTAVFSLMRKFMKGDTDYPIFKSFWQNYKKDFLKSNYLGLIISVVGVVLYLDIYFVAQTNHTILQLVYYPLLLITIVFLLTLLYVFPVFSHYDVNVFLVFRNAVMIMVSYPLHTFMMALGVVAVYFSFQSFPGVIPFYHVSLLAFILAWFSYRAFIKIDVKQQV